MPRIFITSAQPKSLVVYCNLDTYYLKMQLTDWTQSWSKTQTCSPHEAISLNKLRSNESNSGVPAQKVIKSSSWRPMYLTPASLALFSTVFLACLASVQTVFAISNRNRGLSGENDVLHRVLWSYGPVAILTLVSSFWARLETQAKTTSSWLSMARGNTRACQSLLLDYTSQLQPISVISALRYKDYTVAAATIASLLLKILLVLATSLITLSPATVVKQHNISLNLKSEFVDNSNGILANGSLASVYFASMMNFNTTLPQGVSDTYAYQLVESDLLDTPSTLNTTVDGFLGEIDCEPANLYPNGLALNISKSTFLWGYDHNDSIPITAGSCSFQVYPNRVLSGLDGEIEDGDYIVGLQSGVCNDSDSKDNHRLAIIVASLAMSGEDIITFARSNCLICTPTYRILPLDLSAQGPDRLLRPSSGRDSRLLRNVHPWDILNTHANAVPPDQTLHNSSAKISNQTVWFDEHGYLAYQFANKSGNPPTLNDGSFEVLAEESLLPNDDLEMWPPEQSVFKPFSLKLSRDQGLGNVPLNREIISYFWSAFPALILASNLSYSSFTYEDLILPALEVNKTFLSAHPNTSAIEFNTTLLAARPSFTQCRVFNSSQIHVNFTSWRDIGVRVNIDSEECLWYGRDVSSNLNIPLPLAGDSLEDEADIDSLFDEYEHPEYLPLSAEAYFAVGGGTRGSGIQARGCSQRLWVWGQWSTSTIQEVDSPQAISVSALACNESMETVEVEALLFGPDLSIKPSRPPIPHQSATSSVDMRWFINEGVDYNLGHYPDYDLYNGLPYLSTNTTDMLFDPFFTLLTTSRYAVPLDMLGNQSHASTVAEAIKFHHRIIAAQRTAASLERIPSGNISMHNWGYEIVPGTNETSYHATSSIPLDRYRVVQNEFSTRVLQGLLIGILICSLHFLLTVI
ncbi:hypothetical protein J7T55_000893 [Diaporthe amygdali]|uniref:uncharacterized protein n=1 Tax=Phomopsis amygdali TaxID=1214568 RepID=UPI0022FDBEF9|nr:uncharacterized protein J7T55_000893 [Diaporthe amygdali]KAJ0120040.1 hypothetical protein J7T55_000893 [Diaporthe amygdali]